MSKIIKLDQTLSNQIAAWEVVERPVSVVKELVENSIDAWATNVKIEISEGWIGTIIITDNGSWIDKDDLKLVPEKYTTSKIKNLEDLYNIMTFWFRGEAIASISSVSKFEIISKTSEQNFWYSLNVLDGQIWQISKKASENGTKIIVENLFYNTPARLNYLKKPRTEYNHILDILHNISLSYPKVWFEFISDSKQAFKYKPDEDLKTRIYNIYGKDFSENLLELHFEIYWLQISGYISDPKVSFGNRNRQSLFVNNRVIKSPLIYKAIHNAYNRFIPHSTFPGYILNIQVNPTEIDVNVHPRKMEVRFSSEQNIFKWVHSAIQTKLDSVSLINVTNNENLGGEQTQNITPTGSSQQYYTWSWTKFKSYSPYKDVTPNPRQETIHDSLGFSKALLSHDSSDDTRPVHDLHDTALWKIIWQVHNSYIIVETTFGVQMLDQHALAERVIYESLVSNKYKEQTQWLLIWESICLSPKEFDILKENTETFSEMWFDFEILRSWLVMINGIPDFIKKENIQNIFGWIIHDIWGHNFSKSNTLDEVRNKIFAYTACRSAIKFWHKLNLFEMNKLLNDSVIDYSATCPHWRPVIYDIDLNELKDKYER